MIDEMKWCPQCGKKVQMNPIRTGLPGIWAKQCTICNMGYQSNYLEDDEDMVEYPDHFIFPEEL